MAVHDEEDLSPAKSDRNETNCGYGVWQGIRIRIAHSDTCTAVPEVNDVPTHEFETLFNELGVEIESDKIDEWLDSDIMTVEYTCTVMQRSVSWCLVEKTALNLMMKKFL